MDKYNNYIRIYSSYTHNGSLNVDKNALQKLLVGEMLLNLEVLDSQVQFNSYFYLIFNAYFLHNIKFKELWRNVSQYIPLEFRFNLDVSKIRSDNYRDFLMKAHSYAYVLAMLDIEKFQGDEDLKNIIKLLIFDLQSLPQSEEEFESTAVSAGRRRKAIIKNVIKILKEKNEYFLVSLFKKDYENVNVIIHVELRDT